ncbi:cellulose synthase-like protein H1 [Canna indica]|uniref:Cellulose synthase-like protein H1 n=1 Tax=Canna indica TaxID=4628 RepID=A0AAQ3KVF6_9LILI|nr:cellulose synthase-like protein H1 [Canna indica]
MAADQCRLHERVPLSKPLQRLSDLLILFLLLSLVAYRVASLRSHGGHAWFVALVCESWFAFVWLLNVNAKWNRVTYKTFPPRLSNIRTSLPAVDLFVTTADPELEPPIITVNTVLSLLAVDYPVGKLACYVSDDGGSPVTFYSLLQSVKFAKLWVPFCKKYNVRVRAPSVYFSTHPAESTDTASSHFIQQWTHLKNEYEELQRRIESANEDQIPHHMSHELKDFLNIERRNHPSIVKVIWENKEGSEGGLMPHLIYVAREKRPKHPHHYKAGALNVLTRVSGVMTNAAFMLNVDCDMFANNPEVILHGMCLLLGDETSSGFVQAPQEFHGALRDDPFGNQLVVLQKQFMPGLQGIRGPFYAGTGCFHRRKVIYGSPPNNNNKNKANLSREELEMVFGNSTEFIESAVEATWGKCNNDLPSNISGRIEAAKKVASSTYEFNTSWGKEIGLLYGSVTEDVLTGLRCHSIGWRSALLMLEPPAFLGNAPTGGPASLSQQKRWATGLLEIFASKRSPVLAVITKELTFRQCLGYLLLLVWPVRGVVEVCYALLPAYCLLTSSSFLPKASELGFLALLLALFVIYNAYTLAEYLQCGLSIRAWWNNQRMLKIYSLNAWLLGFFSALLKILGISDTIFEVTRKDQRNNDDSNDTTNTADDGRFTFDSSLVFVPGTAVVLVNVSALVLGGRQIIVGAMEEKGAGVGELACSVLVLVYLWPFVKGLVGKGSYGIPWAVICKAAVPACFFMHLCINSV